MANLTVDLSGVKPLLGALGLGQAPDATPKNVSALPVKPLAPQPTPAQAGFSLWSADPLNQRAVTNTLTPPGTPIIPAFQGALDHVKPLNALTAAAANSPMASIQPLGPPAATIQNPMAGIQPLYAGANNQLAQDQAKLQQLQTSGSGVSQIKNPLLRGLARVGDVAGSIISPFAAAMIPGTTLHNQLLQQQQGGRIAADQDALKNVAQLEDFRSQTAQRNAQANAATLAPQIQLGRYGLKMVPNPQTGAMEAVPDETSPAYKSQQDKDAKLQAQTELIGAQTDSAKAQKEYRDAQTAFQKLKADPSSVIYQQAQQRLQTAQQNANLAASRLSLSQQTYNARYLGMGPDGQALPGAMVTDDGRPVGSVNAANVRPTAKERTNSDLASSAAEQLNDIKGIIQRHSTLFGPGYGQTSQFRQWVGSQDPDAQRFMAARTIAADHLAGVFGGRSEAALAALDKAIGQLKDNPDAAIAGIDQLGKANQRFVSAGQVNSVGSTGTSGPASSAPSSIPAAAAAQLREGVNYTFSNGQVWTKRNGKPVRVR